jgi:UDP-glucose 4-epimerase
MAIKRALVTGGAGFIGSHLVDALLENGCDVVVVDNLSTGHMKNLEHISTEIDFREGDIRDLETMKTSAVGCDVIFHLAAMVSVPQTVSDPIHSAQVNDMGSLNVLESARLQGVKRVVLSSSCAVYGDDPEIPKHENMLLGPQSPYAVQKLTNELNARLYAELYGLETVCLRYFNVFGPRQDPSSPYSGVISIFMSRAVEQEAPTIYGDGRQFRDFIYVKDVVRANLLAAASQNTKGAIFNIGTGMHMRINQLWELIGAMAGTILEPVYADARAGDIIESVANIQKAISRLGFKPNYNFQAGLQKTFNWYCGGKSNDV